MTTKTSFEGIALISREIALLQEKGFQTLHQLHQGEITIEACDKVTTELKKRNTELRKLIDELKAQRVSQTRT